METYVHLNSYNRDMTRYPSGNAYTLYVSTAIKNIIKAEVILARVPNTIYYLTSTTSLLSTDHTSTLFMPPGYYADPVVLATEIANRMSNANESFQWVPAEGKFIYLSKNAGTITVNTQDMADLIGFNMGVTYNTVPVTDSLTSINGWSRCFKSPIVVDMTRNDFLFLNIDELNHNNFKDGYASGNPSSGIPNNTGSFTGITMDVPPNTVKIFKNSDYPIAVHFDPPISSVDRFTLTWYDSKRRIVNFQGFEDNAVILRITSAKPPGPLFLGSFEEEKEEEKEPPPKPPLPKVIKDKKTWGRWFILLVLSAIITLWVASKR
jgi:hypothetical protein